MSKLFEFGCKWEHLQTLSVEREQEMHSHQSFHDFSFLVAQVQSDCLGSLEKAEFFVETPKCLPTHRFSWPTLTSVQISTTGPTVYKAILSFLNDAVFRRYLPRLKNITLCG